MNMKLLGLLCAKVRRFKKEEDGSASVEFVLWMPVFVAILMLTIDASLLFMNQSNYWSVSRDTARLVSRHALNEDEAKDYAEARAKRGRASPSATVVINGSLVTVTVSAPASSVSVFNALGLASGVNIDASVTHTMEPT